MERLNEDFASAHSGHWQLCSQLKIGLVRVPGFSHYLAPLPENSHSRNWRSDEAQQIWETLKLGSPLCFLFNQLPGVSDVDVDQTGVDPDEEVRRRATTGAFIRALSDFERSGQWAGGTFALADLYHDENDSLDPSKVIKVG